MSGYYAESGKGISRDYAAEPSLSPDHLQRAPGSALSPDPAQGEPPTAQMIYIASNKNWLYIDCRRLGLSPGSPDM